MFSRTCEVWQGSGEVISLHGHTQKLGRHRIDTNELAKTKDLGKNNDVLQQHTVMYHWWDRQHITDVWLTVGRLSTKLPR